MKKTRRITGITLCLALLLSVVNFTVFAAPREVKLTILGTSDIHANLFGYAYEDNKETTNNGFARVAAYIKSVRAENPNTILIDNGDTYQGTILSDDIYNKSVDSDEIHPISQTLNELAYDAFTLGNHEFNFGIGLIERIKAELNMPVLSANTIVTETGETLVDSYAVVERDGVKIGIIGVTTPNVPRWDGEKVDSLNFESMAEAAQRVATVLKDEENVDLIIISAHAGLPGEYDEDTGSDSAAKILELVPEAAAMLVGHYHIVVKEESGNTVVGAPRNLGRDVVRFDLTLNVEDGVVTVADKSVDVIDMADTEPDEEYRELIKYAHEATLNFIDGGVGSAAEGTGGVFGTASEDFQPVNEINGIPEGKLQDTAVVDLINKVQLQISGADVSAAALFSDSSDIPQGDIKYSNIFNIYKYDNTLYTVDVTGAELKAFMEWSCAHYNTWQPGDINISFDEEIPGYRYDMFAGVDYKIDLSKPVGSRVVDVTFNGEPLEDDQVLKLAVNNYRYSSGLKANDLVAATKDWESPRSIRDYLVEYIQTNEIIDPEIDSNWSITGIKLDYPGRDELIEKVNSGEIEVPYSKALNVIELGMMTEDEVMAITPAADIDAEPVDEEPELTETPAVEEENVIEEVPAVEEEPTIEEVPVAEEEPQVEPEPVITTPTVTAPSQYVKYTVVKGDCLWNIARKYNITYMEIVRLNNISNPDLIHIGQVFDIPVAN